MSQVNTKIVSNVPSAASPVSPAAPAPSPAPPPTAQAHPHSGDVFEGTAAASADSTGDMAAEIAALDAACEKIPHYKNNPHMTPEFKAKIIEVAQKLDTEPKTLVAIMAFESKLNPAAKNKKTNATGLIQFMPGTAKAYKTTTQALGKMSAVEQMDYVEKYFSQKMFKGKLNSPADAYMAVLWPKAVGKPMEYVLFSKDSPEYKQNPLDFDKDGKVTKEEASRKIRKFLGEI